MRLRELFEAISTTREITPLIKIINAAINESMLGLMKDFREGEGRSYTSNFDDIKKYTGHYLYNHVNTFCNAIMDKYPDIDYCYIDPSRQTGKAGVKRAKIDGRITLLIGDSLYSELIYTLMNTFPDIDSFKREWRMIDSRPDVKKVILDVAETLVHELVHVQQAVRQDKYKEVEYRSYLDNIKDEMKMLMFGTIDDYTRKLYYASPQEIPAFANQLVVNLINQIEEKPKSPEFNQKLDELIKTGRFVDKNYEKYNNPDNYKEYKVYKRFMKLVYQGLINYRDSLNEN